MEHFRVCVNVNCIQKATGGRSRVKRQELESQKYDLEISFPTLDGDEVVNLDGSRRERLERLLEQIILEDNMVAQSARPLAVGPGAAGLYGRGNSFSMPGAPVAP